MRTATKQRYWWKGIDDDIANFVRSREKCQLAKAKITRSGLSNAIRRVSNIFSIFSMDLIDMTWVSQNYRYILVLMDYYSNFVLLTNLRNKSAASVVKALWNCFTSFRPPETLLGDNGERIRE